ncbi:unnamed protein product [Rhizoctonia solani]|uniref:Uncharacterized protein n=1 Tax=Rhizoctonia solani TaxID=456999 RepID=A0A8H3C6U5_9AGAM|nr:unnamed protein product [Rhizoctonia solani]
MLKYAILLDKYKIKRVMRRKAVHTWTIRTIQSAASATRPKWALFHNPTSTAIHGKLVTVGDGACGKTCLLLVFSKWKFPEVYVPNILEDHTVNVEVDSKHVELASWDTPGQD